MKKFLSLLIAASLMMNLAACSDTAPTESNISSQAETSSTTQNLSEITAPQGSVATSTQHDEPTAEAAQTEDAAETEEPSYTIYPTPSRGNVFVDFHYIEEVEGLPADELEQDVLNKAIEALNSHEQFIADNEAFAEAPQVDIGEYRSEGGGIAPQLYMAIREDFDMGGIEEHFLLLSAPYSPYDDNRTDEWNTCNITYYLIFVPSLGDAQVVRAYTDSITAVRMLDYGMCKHIIVEDFGTIGACCYAGLYGVEKGVAREYYGLRGSYTKCDCFLSVGGWQGCGGFMYYDTAAKEYRIILGEEIPLDTIREMDTMGVAAEYTNPDDTFLLDHAVLMCNKYYMLGLTNFFAPVGTPYIYKDGKFLQCGSDCAVRCAYIDEWQDINYVSFVDYDTAVSSMKQPSEIDPTPVIYDTPSEGNMFIDYQYIEDVVGMSPDALEEDILQRAVDVLLLSEDYVSFCEDFAAAQEIGHCLDVNMTPQLYRAYRDDFDSNGTTEHFLLLTTPFYDDYYEADSQYAHPAYYLIFVPSEGSAQYLEIYHNSVTAVDMLDYGICRQLIFEDDGTTGYRCHTELYGVDGNEAVKHYSLRGEFTKSECFLYAAGWQGAGGFMYYDTVTKKYREILGEEVPIDTILEMDSTGILEQYKDEADGYKWFETVLLCNKFYMIGNSPMLNAYGMPYLYQSGAFVPCEGEYHVRRSDIDRQTNVQYVIKVDYDTAVSSMLSPSQAVNCT